MPTDYRRVLDEQAAAVARNGDVPSEAHAAVAVSANGDAAAVADAASNGDGASANGDGAERFAREPSQESH